MQKELRRIKVLKQLMSGLMTSSHNTNPMSSTWVKRLGFKILKIEFRFEI